MSYPARVKAEAIALYTRKRLSAAAVAKMLGLKANARYMRIFRRRRKT